MKESFSFSGAEIFGILSWFLTRSEKGAGIASYFLKTYISATEKIKSITGTSSHPGIKIASRILNELNPNARKAFIENFLMNAVFEGSKKRYRHVNGKREILAPFTILISPTMRCNLRCTGCYASDYTRKDDLDIHVIDRIISEGKEMGTYFYTILGGEPFLRSELFDIYRKHNDAVFQVFTNGYLLSEKNCDTIAELGNVAPMISIEGFEKETDMRRGKGTFEKALLAMKRLKERKVFFGASVVPTRYNIETVASERFIDFLIENGAFVLWYFIYMPIGKDPDLRLMPTPEQRNELRLATQEIRAKKPILVVDFWGDAPLVGGCIAGREYIHINSKGEVEPCIFCHFAVNNIHEKSLYEAFNSPFMKNIRERIPYSENLLKPCMIIDNPYVLREVCAETGAKPTHPEAMKLINDFAPHFDAYAKKVSEIYNPIWENEFEEQSEKYLKERC